MENLVWKSNYNKEYKVWYNINLLNRRIEFCYELDSEGGVYRFSLLSECRDDVQEKIKVMLADEGIGILVVEDNWDFYTIVTNSNFQFVK
jgi:hypothetical protein